MVVQAVQFKTDQIADVRKIEKLNAVFFNLMAQGPEGEGTHGLSASTYECIPQTLSHGNSLKA